MNRKTSAASGTLSPNTVHLSKRNLLRQQHSWAAASREILSSSYKQSAGRHDLRVARHAALAECRVLVPYGIRVPQGRLRLYNDALCHTQASWCITYSPHTNGGRWSPMLQPKLWAYMGGIARTHGMKALAIGGMRDHAHLMLSLPATISIAKAVQHLS